MTLNISKENKSFGLTEMILFGENSVVFSFLVLFLKSEGYSGTQTGIITSLTMIACLIAQPVAGFLTDKFIDVKKLITINMLITTAAIGAIYFFSHSFILIISCFFIFSLTGRYVPGLMDVYISKVARRRSGLDYGFVRGLGSFGYAVTALIMGFVISALGYASMFAVHTVFCAAGLLCITRLPASNQGKTEEKSEAPGLIKSLLTLLRNKKYVFAVFSVFIVFLGLNGYGAYLPLYIDSIGGNSTHYGICVFIMAISEIPILWNYSRFTRKFSIERLLMFSLVMSIAKITLPILFDNLIIVIALQTLQALSSGFFIPSVLNYLKELAGDRLMAVAILFASSVYGAGSVVVSNLAGGFIIDRIGLMTFFYSCSAVTAAGAVIFVLSIFLSGRRGKSAGIS